MRESSLLVFNNQEWMRKCIQLTPLFFSTPSPIIFPSLHSPYFLAVYYFILTSFTSPSATTASSSYTLVILLFSIRLLIHFTRFHSVYLNRYSLNSLRLLVESLWNWLWENRAGWRLRGRRRTDYKNTSCSHSLHPSTSSSTWLIPLILLYSISWTLNK